MGKIEFETFKDLKDSYILNQLKQDEPSNINFLNYRKYKVTIELIEEPKETLLSRLESILLNSIGFYKRDRAKKEIQKLNK